jgi:hypothetical protein
MTAPHRRVSFPLCLVSPNSSAIWDCRKRWSDEPDSAFIRARWCAVFPKLGGTKDVNLRRLRELAPTHVIVNIDENEKPTVDEIRETVPHVIATHPLTPLDNVALYRLLGGIFDVLPMAEKLAAQFIDAYDDVVASCSALPRRDVLYLIWRKPWMTVSRDTYISRMLALIGWDTWPEITPVALPRNRTERQRRSRGLTTFCLAASRIASARAISPRSPHCFRTTDTDECNSSTVK